MSAPPTPAVKSAWLAVAGACLCMFCGQPGVAMYTFGVFVPEIAAETQWSAATIASAIGPGALIASLFSPLIGSATDRFGTRSVALVGGATFGVGLALLGLVPQSAAAFVGFTILMWLFAFAGSPVPYAQMVTWLVDRRRGLAISLIFAFGALGIAFWPPFAAYLIAQFGWRSAYAALGAVAGAVIILSALFLLRNAPPIAASVSGKGSGLALREALRTPTFAKIASVFMILTGVLAGAAVNLPIVLRQQGMDGQAAALVMSVVGVSMFGGRVILGPMLDRWFAPNLTIGITLFPIAGFGLLLMGESNVAVFAAAAMIGTGLGAEFNAAAYIVGRAFGSRAYGAIYGFVGLFVGLGGSSGPAAIGVALASNPANTSIIFAACIGLLSLAIGILASIKRSELPY